MGDGVVFRRYIGNNLLLHVVKWLLAHPIHTCARILLCFQNNLRLVTSTHDCHSCHHSIPFPSRAKSRVPDETKFLSATLAAYVKRGKSKARRPPAELWKEIVLLHHVEHHQPVAPPHHQSQIQTKDASLEVASHHTHQPLVAHSLLTPRSAHRPPPPAAMRQTCIFSGSSHPLLVESICERLGQNKSDVALRKFANGETSVEISQSPWTRLPVVTALLTPPCRDFSP